MVLAAIQGQSSAVRALERALAAGRLAHTYLFEGPSGVGKYRTALALGQALVCATKPRIGCGECSACRRARSGQHPDVRTLSAPEDEKHLAVGFLREQVLPLTRMAPFEASCALFIIPDAEYTFSARYPESANVFLKTLEEPRIGVHFVLLSARPKLLLPTIRSRCSRVRFGPLANPVLETIVRAAGHDTGAITAVLPMAGGRVDRALQLLDADSRDERERLGMELIGAVSRRNLHALVRHAAVLAERDDAPAVLEHVASALRQSDAPAAYRLLRLSTELGERFSPQMQLESAFAELCTRS